MNKHVSKITLVIAALAITGCAGVAKRQVSKDQVPQTAPQVRQIIEDLRSKDPVSREDLGTNLVTPAESDRINDIFTRSSTVDSTQFKHPSWKVFNVSTTLVNVNIADFFTLLEQIVGVNFIVGDEVKGDLTFDIKDMNWTQAVETVMTSKQLVSYISEDGRHVRVHTIDFATKRSETMKKILDLNSSEAAARRALLQKSTSMIRIFYSKADQIVKTLNEVINGASGSASPKAGEGSAPTGATFTVESRTNSVIVQATSDDMDWIKKTIAAIDKPSKQILVEAFIVEGRDNFTQELGTRLGIAGRAARYSGLEPTTVSGLGSQMTTSVNEMGEILSSIGNASGQALANTAFGGLGLFATSGLNQLKIELLGMQRDGLTKILSNPRLFIMDNEQAQITDGVQIPYPVAGDGGVTYEFKDAALKLEVKPSIVGDGNIYIEVIVNKDSPNYSTTPPAIDKREVKTKLLIKDGGVAMLGGINSSTVTSTDTGVPLLSKIPGIGNFFKATEQINDKRQLYIFLAPAAI
jgi:type IV pilus assembly protein PilQ